MFLFVVGFVFLCHSFGQHFDAQRVRDSRAMVFRLRNVSSPDVSRMPPFVQRGHSLKTSDHLLDEMEVPDARRRQDDDRTTQTRHAISNTQRYRGREKRRRMRTSTTSSTTTSTTTTTTTTTPAPEYYDYDDYYDDYDYHVTTTTTTTTTASPGRRRQNRRPGRRRFRRPTEAPTTTTTTTLSPNYKQRPDGRIIDYSADPNFPYELRGADLTEYPFYVSIPESKFSCSGRHDGYYADISLFCQVYHHCASGHQRYDFLCPNYTLFDQTTFTCRFVNTVDCLNSENHFNRNNELYVTTIQSTNAARVTNATT
ncbi:uncharacterized protein LOC128952391 isoform X2 [Oppia nitens]|uniref:uncharacterized protein LOC128952391 isoform X2 n=1 Tax=Oppia nitens TaxID=1686743 RepID=UPI0023DB2657|nr:uncharacterized protein LOC128952391 isoform X2 [Oppia nitens]